MLLNSLKRTFCSTKCKYHLKLYSDFTCYNINGISPSTANFHLYHSLRLSSKYTVFRDDESSVIFDVEEERVKKRNEVKQIPKYSFFEDVKTKRAKSGVLDVEEVVDLVKSNKGKNIFVIELPSELKYVNFMVIISGTSRRHINGLAELIRKEFKLKKAEGEITPKIEGANSDWIALDLGNIAVHIMSESVRNTYDLESLWAIGGKYDIKLNSAEDEILKVLKQHAISFDDLHPA